MLFNFCHLERKCLPSLGIMSEKKSQSFSSLDFLKKAIFGKQLLVLEEFNHILLTGRLVGLIVINVPQKLKSKQGLLFLMGA